VFLGKAVQTVNPPSGSVGISQLSATGTKDATTFLRGDNTFAVAGGTTAPYVAVYRSSDQTISDATYTKIEFNAEFVDSSNAFDSTTNYRFTPQTSGYYYVQLNLVIGNTTDNAFDDVVATIYKNGSEITGVGTKRNMDTVGFNFNDTLNTSTIVQLNGSSDYIEAFGYINVTSGTPRFEANRVSMQIFKMTE